jgi:CelD/BcsL family acetyltransferase involved in cellulose biosynthesis
VQTYQRREHALLGQRLEWIEDSERFHAVGKRWDRLSGCDPTPFGRHGWFKAWWDAFGEERKLEICALWRGDELAGVFPLCRDNGALGALANVHTPVFRPLAVDEDALTTLSRAVIDASEGVLYVPALPTGDRAVTSLRRSSLRVGRLALVESQHTSPIVDTDGDLDEYLRISKPRWSAPLERFRRKAFRDYGARFVIVERAQDLEAQLAQGFAVEHSGWKGAAGTSILSDDTTERFYGSVARSFHETGELRLSGLFLDGRLAAFDLSLLDRKRLYLLKTGYDESFRSIAPGLLLRLAIIERCFELGLEAHELLGGNDPWKRKFSTRERRHCEFRSYPSTASGYLRLGYRARLRPTLKRVRDRVP